jgi:hypothetical protein
MTNNTKLIIGSRCTIIDAELIVNNKQKINKNSMIETLKLENEQLIYDNKLLLEQLEQNKEIISELQNKLRKYKDFFIISN